MNNLFNQFNPLLSTLLKLIINLQKDNCYGNQSRKQRINLPLSLKIVIVIEKTMACHLLFIRGGEKVQMICAYFGARWCFNMLFQGIFPPVQCNLYNIVCIETKQPEGSEGMRDSEHIHKLRARSTNI